VKVKRHAIYITRNTSAGVTASREQQQQQQQQQQLVLLAAKCSTEKERQTDRQGEEKVLGQAVDQQYIRPCML